MIGSVYMIEPTIIDRIEDALSPLVLKFSFIKLSKTLYDLTCSMFIVEVNVISI